MQGLAKLLVLKLQCWHPNLATNVANNASLEENLMAFGFSSVAELVKLLWLLAADRHR